jgi:SNF2 family DNA or RNA helicase
MSYKIIANNRAHRTGQTKDVAVSRIIVKDSVEQRILELQEKKKILAAAALGDESEGRIGRLSVQELVGLFGRVTRDADGQLRVD